MSVTKTILKFNKLFNTTNLTEVDKIKLDELNIYYDLKTVNTIIKFYTKKITSLKANEQLNDIIVRWCIEEKINKILNITTQTNITKPAIANDICCDVKMTIDLISDVLICNMCGNFKLRMGDYKLTKTTKKVTNLSKKHFLNNLKYLQALENIVIPKLVINKILNSIKSSHLTNPNCVDIRGILKRLHLTKYNKHTILITQLITGIQTQHLNDSNRQHIKWLFIKVSDASNRLIKSRNNKLSYQFILYKLIDIVLTSDKKSILSNIFLQKPATLIKSDAIWQTICIDINVKFKPTDRHEYI